MSRQFPPLPETILLDLAAVLAYVFRDDKLHASAKRLMERVESGGTRVFVSEVAPYEAEALFMSGKVDTDVQGWNAFVARLWHDPLFPRLPCTAKIYTEHLRFYRRTGGRLTYFDSFHAATSSVTGVPIVTSDGDILSEELVTSIDLSGF